MRVACAIASVAYLAGCGRYGFDGHAPVLVEDFEAGAPAALWTRHEINGAVTVDGSRPHRGAYSLHAHTFATASSVEVAAQIYETDTFPVLQSGMFVREFLYVATPGAPTSMEVYFNLAQQSTGQQLGRGVNGAPQFYQWGTMPDVNNWSKTTGLPLDSWFCVEWQIVGGDSRIWIDDAEVTDLSMSGLPNFVYDVLVLGFYEYRSNPAEPAHDAWIDDIVADTQRVGCN